MNNDLEYLSQMGDRLYLIIGIMLVIFAITYVASAFGLMKVYEKAGAPTVSAWVPGWNIWVFFEVAGMKGYWALLFLGAFIPFVGSFISLAGSVLMIIAAYNISLGFRKDAGMWTLLYFFLGIVWIYMLAFDSSTWQGVTGTPAKMVKENKYEPAGVGNYGNYYGEQHGGYQQAPYQQPPNGYQQAPNGYNPAQPPSPYGAAPMPPAGNLGTPGVESIPNSTAPIENPYGKKDK